jgi:uncharacterized membrane protein SpoIIM required for sporulation
MADDIELRSARFRREREGAWQKLEVLVAQAERQRRLSPEELRALPELYRASLSSLSVARAITLDRTLIAYLESLSARAYLVLYAPRLSFWQAMGEFLKSGFPQSVRHIAGMVWLAMFALALGTAVGWYLVAVEPGYFLTIVPASLHAGRTPMMPPEALKATLYPTYSGFGPALTNLATFLFRNNASVALLAFGLGIALGIPTLFLMFYNGTITGAFLALFAANGLLVDLSAWLSVHGTTEILAIVLAGGAGFAIARGFLFPRPGESRFASVARDGAAASQVALGAIMMLFVAAILEGFVRQLVTDLNARFLIGAAFLALWFAYFAFAGRRHGR